jgi:hypothetical protein
LNLTQAQLGALSNLANKKAGQIVGWIGIAEARALTDLGFAARNRSGWEITEAGANALAERGNATAPEAAITPLRPPPSG